MKFAKRVFFWAGIYGLAVTLPAFFMEKKIGMDDPPPITHPELFYGFLGLIVAFQAVFLILSTDPVRYRPLMAACMLEKFIYAAAVAILLAQGRVGGATVGLAAIDAALGVLFVISYVLTPKREALPS